MVCRQCTSTFRYDIRVRDTIFIAHVYQRRDRVVYILLNRIVHAAFTIGRPGTVIVNTQASTDINKLNIEAHCV